MAGPAIRATRKQCIILGVGKGEAVHGSLARMAVPPGLVAMVGLGLGRLDQTDCTPELFRTLLIPLILVAVAPPKEQRARRGGREEKRGDERERERENVVGYQLQFYSVLLVSACPKWSQG